MKRIFIMFILIFITANIAQAKIIAIVGDDLITQKDLQERLMALKILNPTVSSNDESFKKNVLASLVEEKLYLMAAKSQDITISDQEIEETLKATINKYPKLSNLVSTVKQQIKSQLSWKKFVNSFLRYKVAVSENEIKEAMKYSIKNAKLNLAFVLIENSIFDKHRNNILDSLSKIKSCNEINDFTKKFNIDKPQRVDINSDNLNEEIKSIVTYLPIGKASEIIEINDHKQIIFVCNRIAKPLNKKDLEEIKFILEEKKLALIATNYLNDLRKKTYIEYK